ncbi:MAG: OB-fold nucleic acid binding domain-containing protein [Candidatus Micrarchaeota archaeon]
MDDKTLLVTSLFFALTGIIVLFLLSKNLQPIEVSLDSLSGEDVGKFVLVKGTVRSFYSGEKLNSFDLCYGSCVKIVDFERKQRVSNGFFVSIEGRVSEFEGSLEVVADSVEVLNSGG